LNSEAKKTVRVSRSFHASAAQVFDAWLNPQIACNFLFATPTGEMVRTEIDARVGGSFLLVDRREGLDVEHIGEYLELDRPRRIVFSFRVPHYSAESSRVTVEFEALENGCDLTLSHQGVLPKYEASTQAGWTMILDALDAALKSFEI
jgi:uncharacterized protein YndB with AHSA1/START domain